MDSGRAPAANLFLTGALALLVGTAIYWFGPLIPPKEGLENNGTMVLLIGVVVALIGAVVLIVATYRFIGSVDYLVRRSEARDQADPTDIPQTR